MSTSIKKSQENQFSESGTSPTGVCADLSTHGALNIAQAAAYAGVRSSAIEEVIRDGRLPGRRLGRNIVVLKRDLDSFLEVLEVIPPHVPPSIMKRQGERAKRKVAA